MIRILKSIKLLICDNLSFGASLLLKSISIYSDKEQIHSELLSSLYPLGFMPFSFFSDLEANLELFQCGASFLQADILG
jgi:hypothetical protein